jgi:hypothetical protein
MPGGSKYPYSLPNTGTIGMIVLFIVCCLSGCSPPPRTQTPPKNGQGNQIETATSPEAGISPGRSPTATGSPAAELSQKEVTPTKIPVLPIPTFSSGPEREDLEFVPVLGGADGIVFINQDDIWMVNLDGAQLTRLTSDGSQKRSLQWHSRSKQLSFVSAACVKVIEFDSLVESSLVCFDPGTQVDSFQVSQDGKQAAVSLDGELYVFPYHPAALSQVRTAANLEQMAECPGLAPYKHRQSIVLVKKAYWSDDGQRLAILRTGFEDGAEVEFIQILDTTRCTSPIPRLDEFPATRIEMDHYTKQPVLQDFGWDGGDLFAVTDFKRNDGFGDLWIYSTSRHQGFKANPIQGKCCYRDPVFSPNGKYIAFAFQDASLGADGAADLFSIPFAALDSSLVFSPLPLPDDFFSELHLKPQPVYRSTAEE